MEIHALFEDGSASRVILEFFASDPADDPVRLACIGIEDRQMVHSAQNGCISAYHLLARRGYIKPADRFFPSCQFAEALVNIQARGSSAGLAFCLKFASEVHRLSGAPPAPFSVAATGTIENSSRQARIGRVEGVETKLRGALRALQRGDLLFVPAANAEEVPEEIRHALAAKGIELIPVATVEEALQRLIPAGQDPPAPRARERRGWRWTAIGAAVMALAAGGYWAWERSAAPEMAELTSWCEEGRYLDTREGLEQALDRSAADPAAAQLYRQLKDRLGLQIEFHHQPAARKSLQPEHLSLTPSTEKVELAPGDLYRLSFTPEDSLYLYVFRHTGPERLEMLWPVSAIEGAGLLRAGKKYYLPEDTQTWFKQGESGNPEQLCLVAARRRGLDLERLYRRYEGTAGQEQAARGLELLEALASRQTAQQAGLAGVYYTELTLDSATHVR